MGSRRSERNPFAILGLDERTATRDDIAVARRRLAQELHPDLVGGDGQQMGLINRAADEAIARVGRGVESSAEVTHRQVHRDHPSFIVDVLPVEAFEALLIVTGWLGQLVDDDPPYRLEVVLENDTWCSLDLVPDAGGTTVSVTIDALAPADADADVDRIRNLWVSALNLLDWEDLDPSQPRPW